jgi:hypothetical protein
LHGEPVMAVGSSFGYRARKLIWRHRTAAVLVTLTAIVLLAVTAYFALRARSLGAGELRAQRDLAAAYQSIGDLEMRENHAAKAVDAYRKAVQVRAELLRRRPADAVLRTEFEAAQAALAAAQNTDK